jgi:2,3-bisphosphoglycerate-independent phosphoglycerate mutase
VKSFKKYYYDMHPKEGAGITFIDVDETLFHTKAKIRVIKNGQTIKELDNQQFNTYKLQPGESYDFGEFRSAELFRKTSTPIEPILKRINRILYHIKEGNRPSKVVILTARGTFDDMEEFKNTFRDHGVQIDDVEIKTVGDKPGAAAARKKEEVRNYLTSGKYKRARMFDDADSNLEAFLSLQEEFPDVEFKALKVSGTGDVQEVS